MKLVKTEIARRQLGTALALFLEDSDPVSVHALACAGCEIAEYLTDKAGEKPFSTHALATFPDLKIGEIRQLQNQYWNAFKHARTRGGIERKDRELLERFGDEVNDHTLFIGWYDYMLAVRLGHARIAYQRVGRQRSTAGLPQSQRGSVVARPGPDRVFVREPNLPSGDRSPTLRSEPFLSRLQRSKNSCA